MMTRSIFGRLLAVFLAVVIAAGCMAVNVSADTAASYTVFEGTQKIDGWFPSFITQYMAPDKMADFISAIKHDGATIEITYTGSAQIAILLQSYPVKDGSQNYPHASISNCTTKTSGGKTVAVFKAADMIKAYTDTVHPDDNSHLSLSNVLNFGIGGEGNTIYSVVVRWTYSGDPSIKVDLRKTYQTMEGFGASYTWYGDWITNLSSAKKKEVFDWVFNECGLIILRFRYLNKVRAYGGSWESTNYKSRAYYEWYKAAKDRGVDPIVIVTSWGEYREEGWVTQSKDSEGHVFNTLKKDANGNYRYSDLANFCVQSVQYFLDAGIPVDYFSIANEVELQRLRVDENGNAREDAGFYLSPTETSYSASYAKAYVAVYDAFQKAFGKNAPTLLAAETMAADVNLLNSYIDAINKERPGIVTDVAHHLYGSTVTADNFARIGEQYYGKYKLWQTEWYNKDFLGHAGVMIDELANENINAYLYWAGYWLYETGDADGEHLIDVKDYSANPTITRRGNHFIMAHFARFIKRGYVRVDSESYACNSKSVAFKSPDGKKLVIVALNNSSSDETLKLEIGAEVKSAEAYRTTKKTDDVTKEATTNEYMKKMNASVKDGSSISLPAYTLTTLILDLDGSSSSSEPEKEPSKEPSKEVDSTAKNEAIESAKDNADKKDTSSEKTEEVEDEKIEIVAPTEPGKNVED